LRTAKPVLENSGQVCAQANPIVSSSLAGYVSIVPMCFKTAIEVCAIVVM